MKKQIPYLVPGYSAHISLELIYDCLLFIMLATKPSHPSNPPTSIFCFCGTVDWSDTRICLMNKNGSIVSSCCLEWYFLESKLHLYYIIMQRKKYSLVGLGIPWISILVPVMIGLINSQHYCIVFYANMLCMLINNKKLELTNARDKLVRKVYLQVLFISSSYFGHSFSKKKTC